MLEKTLNEAAGNSIPIKVRHPEGTLQALLGFNTEVLGSAHSKNQEIERHPRIIPIPGPPYGNNPPGMHFLEKLPILFRRPGRRQSATGCFFFGESAKKLFVPLGALLSNFPSCKAPLLFKISQGPVSCL
ncbi:uncharacterized protein TM35_000251570 [Trypanosoma theileri]|uniref:Uncharacterized protein n=1 Tax=Trypanosoma theileri TaxID=67003 RepID=A0A1X0NQI4_9TRYP|nr:uncharacterized protein TM35_000251570 [Trypanosoma theileri]ORC86861.1 hypothetical protein TM35_000251570 [Trypanosoma theileri]